MDTKLPTLDELRALERAATPGPWKAETWYGEVDGEFAAVGPHHQPQPVGEDGDYEDDGPTGTVAMRAEADAALIAAARNALPHLLAIAEAAQTYRYGAHDCNEAALIVAVDAALVAGLFGEVVKRE